MDMPSISPNKRKRGRPKGSKNSTTSTHKKSKAYGPKRRPGRPKGSKNSMTTGNKQKKTVSKNKQKKSYDPKRRKVEYSLNFDSRITEGEMETGNQKIAESVLMRFDAVRRRFCQLGIKHHLLPTALSNCMKLGMMTNMKKRIGPVPGVNVGDIFFYWREMNLVGLHLPNVQGIDYLTKKDGAALPLATSVATLEQIAGETYETETLIYTGQGGKKKDQVLKTGNLALERSIIEGNDVRVIRCQKDPNKKDQKIYFYDGLYSVSSFWTETPESSGFKVFKFKMVRKPGQPFGYATWKKVEQWRKYGFDSSVNGFINRDLSNGVEALPISVVNEVDENDKTVPGNFKYITSQHHSSLQLINTDLQSLGCQNCQGHSCPKDSDCNCLKRNNGKLPYFNNILVCRTSMVYECGDRCLCFCDCKMRVVQKGLKLRVQVFKTEKCGWGLRSWEPIRAGTFICEFAGMSMRKEDVEVDDEYLFDTSRFYNQFSWNYEPELVDEDFREQVSEVFNLPNQVLISGKEYGNVSRFMNHSCSPNILWQPIMAETEAGSDIRIGFFAMKNIPPLTELRYDYGTSFVSEESEEDGQQKFKGRKTCLCGSVECRGYYG